MIHYTVRCDAGHTFDGWFRSGAAFDAQAAKGLVTCPACGSVAIQRALMAPSLASGAAAPVVDQSGASVASPEPTPGRAALMPDQLRAALQRIRAEVERHCEDVGPRFADEARRIHGGESPARGIYGETTPDEARSLAEDGIEVTRVPWVPRADG